MSDTKRPRPRGSTSATRDALDLSRFGMVCERPSRVLEPLSWAEHIPFAFFLVQMHRPRILVELGVHSGNSYNAFCQAVDALGLTTTCYGVDTWEGDSHAGRYGEEIYEELSEFQKARFGKFSNLLRMTFDEALAYFSDGSIDLLHIDGLHTYEAVKHDFDTWLPKMSARGLVLLHDVQVKEREFGVWRLWEEVSQRYPAIRLRHGHGLGALFVGDAMPDELAAFFSAHRASDFYGSLFHRLGRCVALEAEQELARAERKLIDERHQRELEALQARCAGLEQNLEEASQRLQTLGGEKAGLEQRIQELGQDLAASRGEANALREETRALRRETQAMREEAQTMREETQTMWQERQSLWLKIQAMGESIQERAAQVEQVTLQLGRTTEELATTRQRLQTAEQRHARLDALLAGVRALRFWRR